MNRVPTKRLTLLLLATLAAACTSPCLELAKKVCKCEETISAKNACERRAEAEEANINLSDSDEDRCDDLLDKCKCGALDTPEGRVACGLAREPATPTP